MLPQHDLLGRIWECEGLVGYIFAHKHGSTLGYTGGYLSLASWLLSKPSLLSLEVEAADDSIAPP